MSAALLHTLNMLNHKSNTGSDEPEPEGIVAECTACRFHYNTLNTHTGLTSHPNVLQLYTAAV